MAAKRIYGCILFLAIIVLTGNQQCQAARNLIQSLSPSLQLQQQKIHFVLVHGACHGAWCWYKLQTLLESAGHRVTAIDLAASGINTISINDLRTYINYTQPLLDLMESIPEGEKVVLVGHSMGGYDLAFSMEQYPQKISFAVFLTAILPDIADEPSCAPPELGEWYGMLGGMLDNQIAPFGRPEDNLTSLLFGPRALAQNLYQLSPPEDLTLAKSLVRPAPIFGAYLANRRLFSNEKFGSVKRAFIICKQDRAIREEFQRWMIENTGVAIVKEIEDADHMAMISKPEKVYQYLLEIAEAFSEKLMSSF